MCLYVKKRFVAKKPIIAYKVGYEGRILVTPFQRTGIPFNQPYTDVEYNPSICHKHPFLSKKCIEEGFIHSCTTKEEAKWVKKCLFPDIMLGIDFLKIKIFTVIIPKGAIGYYGMDSDICSNQIIVLNPNLPGYEELCTEYGLDPSSNTFS